MMYNEFLELTGISEQTVSYSQYQFDVEPAYTFIDAWQDKKQFCEFYKVAGFTVVCQISAMIMAKIKLEKDKDHLIDEKHEVIIEKCDLQDEVNEYKRKLHDIRAIIRG